MREFLIKKFSEYGFSLSDMEADNFLVYYKLLAEWNEKMNLTAIIKFEDVVVKHFIDSACGLPFVAGRKTLCDIGAGAGFPSLPLKILSPEIELTMMDSLNKRIVFLEEAVRQLTLKGCKCLHKRAEEAAAQIYRESFDAVTARAVASLSTLCEYALPLVRVGGIFLSYKGEAAGEIKSAENAIKILGGKIAEVKNFKLEGMERTLIVIEKVKHTDRKYPRGLGKERSQPL